MLQFYYNPISVNARRVWVALLEKQIPFEPILINLDGDHLGAEFTALNPLQRVPVIVDAGFRVLESLWSSGRVGRPPHRHPRLWRRHCPI